MHAVEEQLIKWLGDFMGWIAVGIASVVAWAVRTSVFNRLSAIEDRMAALERLAAAAVSQVELAKSVDGLRDEIYKTRIEIKQDVNQIVHLLRGKD